MKDAPDSRTLLGLTELRKVLSVPLLCDALDAHGYRSQSPRLPIRGLTLPEAFLLGRCKTTQWGDMAYVDPDPYQHELAAVDSCQRDDILICAASGSDRSGIWGELLTTASLNRGCIGVIVDGSIRDCGRMRAMGFPVFARGVSPYDSRDRQRVVAYDVPVELGSVRIDPGDLIAADEDGIVVVPKSIESEVVSTAWKKAHAENQVREAIRSGMSATEAFATFGVL